MKVNIEKKEYQVKDDEFTKLFIQEYCNLDMYNDLAEMERIIGLINEISIDVKIPNVLYVNPTHGGFIPINCSKQIQNNILVFNKCEKNIEHINNAKMNITNLNIKNISIIELTNHFSQLNVDIAKDFIIFANELDENIIKLLYNNNQSFVISNRNETLEKIYSNCFSLSNTNKVIYVPKIHLYHFYMEFKYNIKLNNPSEKLHELNYDNLIHLCIMVKNGGDQFEQMLRENSHLIDRWTILDTGSSDNTIDIIKKVLGETKKGNLYEEPFINFRDSRNRLLDLAGDKCKYTLMLDDTYVIKGDLRKFLNTTRSDQFSDSFSLYIKSDDVEYGSNRILKTNRNLKYLYKIHEVIQSENNNNVVVPMSSSYILDERFDYMEERTMNRKSLDLKLLFEELEDNSDNPRTYYYLGQTYNLLEDHQSAFKWMMERVNHKEEGFMQEKVDACFEAARIANFKLNKPWSEVEPIYLRAYDLDKERPDALYFLGIHYYLENNYLKAYGYFKKAFEIGYPSHKQYSLKPTLSFHFLPKFLTRTCYHMLDNKLGEQSAEFFLKNNKPTADDYNEVVSWYNIYKKLNMCDLSKYKIKKTPPEKPIFVFVADGGFNQWSGKNILTTGVGGSETYIIEMARYIQTSGQFDVVVFCNCSENEAFEGVEYKHLNEFYQFINENKVHSCIVSRFSEYLPVAFRGLTENVYLVVHDLTPSGIVIPIDAKLKNVFCLTEWHVGYMNERFPSLSKITLSFYYGIDSNKFLINETDKIVPYKFIYSSFPNRGLLPLLQMWPKIYEKESKSSLHIYTDVNGKWVNEIVPEQMKEVRRLLEEYKHMNIVYHGWVNKQTLANAWITSDIWFYPCTFMETFCLTALEAATTRTFAITNDLAALQNTVGNRGAVIKGDASTNEWQEKALETLFYYMDEKKLMEKQELIEKNYEWARELTWKNQTEKLLSEYIKPSISINNYQLQKQNTDIQIEKIVKINNNDNNVNNEKIKHFNKIKDTIILTYETIDKTVLPLANSFGRELEGSMFNEHRTNCLSFKYKDKQTNICDVMFKNNIKNVLEIGFNAGFSTMLMLMTNPNINITCVDICEHPYAWPCYEWISKKFPGRIEFIKGKSEDVLPTLIERNRHYDMIHIDGGHGALTVFHDIQNSIKMAKENTILIMDDYNEPYINLLWNLSIDFYKLEKYTSLKDIEEQSICVFKKN